MGFRFFILICFVGTAWAAEVAGIKLDDKSRVGNSEVVLSGAGVRKRVFFDVYAIGLYVANPKSDPLSQPGPKRIAIYMLRDVGADQFSEALTEGMRANNDETVMKSLDARLAKLSSIMSELKEAKKGTAIALDWTGADTQVIVNGKPAGQPIAGEDFYRALLRIWLGPRPVQDDLKKALLGSG